MDHFKENYSKFERILNNWKEYFAEFKNQVLNYINKKNYDIIHKILKELIKHFLFFYI